MNPEYIMTMGTTLKEIINSDATKYAVQAISTVKTKRNDKETISAYEDIFNKLIQENQELKRIALAYKDEYENINIKNEDIEYLQKTSERIIKMFFPTITEEEQEKYLENNELSDKEKIEYLQFIKAKEEEQKNFMMMIDFIQVDTLRTMQMLGFNYKKAIGEPLTQLCSQSILKLAKKNQ